MSKVYTNWKTKKNLHLFIKKNVLDLVLKIKSNIIQLKTHNKITITDLNNTFLILLFLSSFENKNLKRDYVRLIFI